MRFQVIKPTGVDGMQNGVWDSKLLRYISFSESLADAHLVAQALELQEVKTLEQLNLPLKLSDKVKVIPIEDKK